MTQINLYGVNKVPKTSIKLISNPKVTELTGNSFKMLYTNLDDFSGTQINIGIIVTSVPSTTTETALLFTFADSKATNVPNKTDAIITETKWIRQASSKVIG